MKPILVTILCMVAFVQAPGQGLKDYEDIITLEDTYSVAVSNLDEISELNLKEFWFNNPKERRFGFIGKNYRRLDIVFISIIKDPDNPLNYLVYGKSRVSENICEFQGTIEIKESNYLKSEEYFAGKGGVIVGDYHFYEDRNSNHPGIFSGRFVTYWNKDKSDSLVYMRLPAIEGNNQFVGNWKGYGNSNALACNWGDSRIPFSGDLDVGTSEFGINRKYQQFGWDSFIKAYGGGFDTETTRKARETELEKWWK